MGGRERGREGGREGGKTGGREKGVGDTEKNSCCQIALHDLHNNYYGHVICSSIQHTRHVSNLHIYNSGIQLGQ